MFRSIRRWQIGLSLALLSLALVVACQRSPQSSEPAVNSGADSKLDSADCTVVEHVAGDACIPKAIQQLVTLDGVAFEYAIAAGLDPIGNVSSEFQTQLPALMTDAKNIGKNGEPSLEEILSLQPDLIVGLESYEGIYAQLSQIAPTLLVNFEHSGRWKTIFQEMSAALGQTAAAQSTLDAYQARTDSFRAQIGEAGRSLKVSIIRIYPDSINLYLKDSFGGTILQDAGLARPAAQDISASEAEQRFDNPIQTSISRELLSQADGDVIFIWTGENTPEGTQQAESQLQTLQRDPLWQQLKAVQTGRVYQVPNYWIGSGPIAANAVLDDLFKYLIAQPS